MNVRCAVKEVAASHMKMDVVVGVAVDDVETMVIITKGITSLEWAWEPV